MQRLQHILDTCSGILETDDKGFIAEMIANASDIESFRTDVW